jgi:hypothetical protein
MKNYKGKTNDEEKLRFILESRLQLQSVKRYLDAHKIPHKGFDYFRSKEFVEKHFMKMGTFEQKMFLENMVGKENWKKFEAMLEKE